jgi:hypothetical protein
MIEFKTKELAKKAVEKMHKFKVGDREIVVREVKTKLTLENFCPFLLYVWFGYIA